MSVSANRFIGTCHHCHTIYLRLSGVYEMLFLYLAGGDIGQACLTLCFPQETEVASGTNWCFSESCYEVCKEISVLKAECALERDTSRRCLEVGVRVMYWLGCLWPKVIESLGSCRIKQ